MLHSRSFEGAGEKMEIPKGGKLTIMIWGGFDLIFLEFRRQREWGQMLIVFRITHFW